jgi:hypothetical protein
MGSFSIFRNFFIIFNIIFFFLKTTITIERVLIIYKSSIYWFASRKDEGSIVFHQYIHLFYS